MNNYIIGIVIILIIIVILFNIDEKFVSVPTSGAGKGIRMVSKPEDKYTSINYITAIENDQSLYDSTNKEPFIVTHLKFPSLSMEQAKNRI